MNRAWKKRNGAKVRLAARRAKLIREGINQSFSTEQVVDDFVAMNFQSITPQEARQWAITNVRTNDEALRSALFSMYLEAYALGEDIAMSAIAKARISKAPTLRQLQQARV